MYCRNCGRVVDHHTQCPDCGKPVVTDQIMPSNYYQQAKNYGITGIVMSGISFIIFGFLAFAGFVFGILGLVNCRKASKNGEEVSGLVVMNILATIMGATASFLLILYYISELNKPT